jgi:hypothetical protein
MIYHTQCDIIIIGSFGLTRPGKAPNDYNITLSVVDRGLKPWSSQTKAPNDYNITLSVVDRGTRALTHDLPHSM